MEYVWLALAVAVMALFAWLGFRIEPHWVAKDRSRFIGNAQLMTDKGEPVGRFRETRVLIEPDGELLVDQRRFMRRRHSSVFRLVAESDDPPRRRALFLMRGHDLSGLPTMLAVRVPANSKILPTLRELLTTGSSTTPKPPPAPTPRPTKPPRSTRRGRAEAPQAASGHDQNDQNDQNDQHDGTTG